MQRRDWHIYLAAAHSAADDYEACLKAALNVQVLEKQLGRPHDIGSLEREAYSLLKLKRYDEGLQAVRRWEAALEDQGQPRTAYLFEVKTSLLSEAGRNDEAMVCVEAGLGELQAQGQPGSETLYKQYSYLLSAAGRSDESLQALLDAEHLRIEGGGKDDPWNRRQFALIYEQHGKWPEAMGQYSLGADLYIKRGQAIPPDYYYDWAFACSRADEKAEARRLAKLAQAGFKAAGIDPPAGLFILLRAGYKPPVNLMD
jgi:tetratricopeptide (TPR) repeat protein